MKDIVDKNTIQRHMQSLEGFRMRKNITLSFVDESVMKRKFVWEILFLIFWKCVILFLSSLDYCHPVSYR